jgi:hypothetical protein
MYDVVIKTAYKLGSSSSIGTDAPAFMTLHGSAGVSPKTPIGDSTQPMFEAGYLDRFTLQLDKSVEDVSKAVLSLEPTLLEFTADWGVEWVRITDMHNRRAWKFCANKWVSGPPESDWSLTLEKPCATGEQQGAWGPV